MEIRRELNSWSTVTSDHLTMPLFHQEASSVCHSRGKESMGKDALALEWFHPEVTHMISSHLTFTKTNHMSTNFNEWGSAVLPSAHNGGRGNIGELHACSPHWYSYSLKKILFFMSPNPPQEIIQTLNLHLPVLEVISLFLPLAEYSMLTKLNRTHEKLDVNKRGICLLTQLPTGARKSQQAFNFSFSIILCLPKITPNLMTGPAERGNQMELKVAANSYGLELAVAGFQGTSCAINY